jgi:succinoglycan biosynthesis transport protein ExoP
MNLIYFVRLLQKQIKWMLFLGLSLAIIVLLLTLNLPREYESEAELNSGVSTSVNLGDIGPARMDFLAVSAKVDNIINTLKSRHTMEEVSVKLLSYHIGLGSDPDERLIKQESIRALKEMFPEETLAKWASLSEEERISSINEWKQVNVTSDDYFRIFVSENSPYGLKTLSKVTAFRIGGSDLIKLTYRWRDPGVAQKSLKLMVETLIANMKGINLQQSRDVVAYFERELAKAADSLEFVEEIMKTFRAENNLLNYYEQTEALSVMKENMEDEYQKEIASLNATKAALVKLERQLEVNRELLKYGRQLLLVKDKLAEVQRQIAIIEVGVNDQKLLETLRKEEAKLENQLKTDLLNRSAFERTTDGVEISKLLGEWVDASLELDERKARVAVFQERQKYFREEYKRMTPLGSRLSKIERKIAVKEEYYLEVLHGLNQAVLHKQTLSLSSDSLRSAVEPTYPGKPLPSKRLLLILLSFVLGFILPYLLAFLRDLLDQSIKTKRRAEYFTKKKVIAGFPSKSMLATSLEIDELQLNQKSVNQLLQNIRNERLQGQPVVLNLLSFSENSEKELFSEMLMSALSKENFKHRVFDYSGIEEGLGDNYREYMGISRIIGEESLDVSIVIHPNLLQFNYNPNLIERRALNLYVLNATNIWTVAESSKLQELEDINLTQEAVVLMNVSLYELENIVGEIPKKRSRIRVFLKRLLSFQTR